MSLHQSSRSRYKHFKCSAHGVVETLQTFYVLSFGTKDCTHSTQYTLYKNSNSICEAKAYLPNKISKNSDFAGLNSAITTNEEEEANTIILHLYESNTQIRQNKQLSFYHKVDPTVLWFVNTVSCQRRLILTYYMQVSTFTMSYFLDFHDNYIYKNGSNRDVPVYNIHDITAKQSIYYFDSQNQENEEILVEYSWLLYSGLSGLQNKFQIMSKLCVTKHQTNKYCQLGQTLDLTN